MSLEFLQGALPGLLQGLWVALQLLAAVTVLGMVGGLVVVAGHLSRSPLLRGMATAYDLAFRGLPPPVLLLVVFYGSAEILELPSFMAAAVALGLRAGAYFARIFQGAIEAVPATQRAAAQAIGLGPLDVALYVVLPQAFRHALPSIGNEVSSQFKLTSLAFVVGVVELSRQARYLITAGSGSMLLVFLMAAALYYIANSAILATLAYLEHRLAVPGMERRAGSAPA